MTTRWQEILKFLSGAFFVTAGASWYFAGIDMAVPVPLLGTFSPEFLRVRGFLHFAFFLLSLYFGFVWKPRRPGAGTS